MNRRALLLGTSAAALTAVAGSGPADAQVWRFLRGGSKGGGGARPTCPPHAWVLYGTDPKTGRYVMRCMKCGLFKIN
jgi:hypothetical protein